VEDNIPNETAFVRTRGAAHGTRRGNLRAQVASLAAAKAGTSLFGLSYTYGPGAQDNGTISQVANTLDNTRSQSFTYDWLNRLSTAQEGTRWGDAYGYDNFGNLLTKTPLSGMVGESVSLSLNTTPVTNQVQGTLIGYDAAGNMTTTSGRPIRTMLRGEWWQPARSLICTTETASA
jgi:hypothetical protein